MLSKESFGKLSADLSEILWRRIHLGIIWDIVFFPLGSGFFAVVWFSRLTRCAFLFWWGFTELFNF